MATRKYAHRTGYQIRLGIYNTNLPMLRRLTRIFSVGLITPNRHSALSGRTCWSWCLFGHNARKFLRLIYPYLVAKRQQAKLAIETEKYLLRTNHPDPWKIKQQKRCHDELSRLKWIGFTGVRPKRGHRT